MTPNWTWTLNSQRYSTYTKCLPLRPNFGRFRSTISRFRDTRSSKKEMPRMTPNWTSTLYSPFKSTMYTWNTYPWGPIFGPFHSMASGFEDLSFTTDFHVKQPKKEQNQNCQKIQNLKFHYSFNKFVRDPPQEYAWILGSKSGVLFQMRCHLKRLPPYGPMLTKTKKKWQKFQNLKLHKSLNKFGRDPS